MEKLIFILIVVFILFCVSFESFTGHKITLSDLNFIMIGYLLAELLDK